MKSLSISEAKFIYYAHHKLDYTNLDKVGKIKNLLGDKFPESDRSIDAHSYYKALQDIIDGYGIPSSCILCGMKLDDENMMCSECEATIRSMASRGYKEVKQVKDAQKRIKRRKELIIGGLASLVVIVILTLLSIFVFPKIGFTKMLDKRLKNEGYVSPIDNEQPYNADGGGLTGNYDMDYLDKVLSPNAIVNDVNIDDFEIGELDITKLDLRDSMNMLGRDYETVFSIYGNPTLAKEGSIYYEKTEINLEYDEETKLINKVYADKEVSKKKKVPICGVYVGLDIITAVNEIEKFGLKPVQVDLYTWECVCKCGDVTAAVKITEKNGKVGVICIGTADNLQ